MTSCSFDNPYDADVIGLWDYLYVRDTENNGPGVGVAPNGLKFGHGGFGGGWFNGTGTNLSADGAPVRLEHGTLLVQFELMENPAQGGDHLTVISRGQAAGGARDGIFELRILRGGAVQVVHRDNDWRVTLATQAGFADCYDVISVTYSWSSSHGAAMRVDNMTDGRKCQVSRDLIGLTFDISKSETFVSTTQENDDGMPGTYPGGRIDYVAILDKPVLMDRAVAIEGGEDAPLDVASEMAAGDDPDFDAAWIDLGPSSVPQYETMTPCFTPGTLIATPKGERKVEELEIGDRVITRDNGIREIRWVGRKLLTGAQLAREDHLRPILIRAGALGVNLPERDMMVSPNHRILVSSDKTALYFEEREVLVAAKHLTGLDGVDMVDVSSVTYVHFMFDQHEMVLSDGAWTESFQPCNQSLKGIGNAQRNEIFELFPMLKTKAGLTSYPPARRTLDRFEAQMLLQ